MKKLLVLPLLLLLTACGGVDDIKQTDEEKPSAKTTEATASEEKDTKAEKEKAEDIWTYYEDAKWEDNFKGLKTQIKKVVVSDKAPGYDDDGNEIVTSAVGVKVEVENTTEGKFTTYPDQATLVTSTGEQVDASMFLSDDLGGEIDKGVIKDGNVIFYLDRGNAEKIEWIKLSWSAVVGAEDDFSDDRKEYEVELKLR